MRIAVAVVLLSVAGPVFAKDVYLAIGGQVGNFFTDARVFNPSFDEDIVIDARYLQNNQNNSGAAPVAINVPKRTMLVYDDVVNALFPGKGGIGAIRLTSDADFVATQRIYADVESKTLGQFVPGLDAGEALARGVLIQLKQNTGGGVGTFRTNLGAANPNGTAANVTFELHDASGALAGTRVFQLQPFGVLTPSRIDGFFSASADLSDAWIGFSSDQPVFVYGSVIDNGSEDPTFVPAFADSGTPPPTPPPPQAKSVGVTAANWFFTLDGIDGLTKDDEVTFTIRSEESTHGFSLVGPNGESLINLSSVGATAVERTVVLPAAGTYTYFCTFTLCGEGHSTMSGQFDVQ